MLSEAQQRRVWEGMLSAEIRANYFADLSGKYHRKQRGATWTILFLSSGAVVTFLYTGLPAEIAAWLRPVLALLTAAMSFYLVMTQNQKLAFDSADLHSRWNRLASKYEALWENVYADEAEEHLQRLTEEGIELSTIGTAFPHHKNAMRRWQDHVERHHAARVPA
jgi:hypothetical protein